MNRNEAPWQQDWQQDADLHRLEVRKLVQKAMEDAPEPAEIAVIGSGHWDDLDLTDMAARAFKVVYMDLANSGSQSEAQAMSGTLAQKISVRTNVDLLGLERLRFQERWQSLLDQGAGTEELKKLLLETGEHLRREQGNVSEQDKRRFSVVVSMPVYTQLFYIDALLLMAPYMEKYGREATGQLTQLLTAIRTDCLEAYNRAIFSLVRPDGQVVVWTDIMKVDEQTQAVVDGLYMNRTEKERVRSLFTAFGQFGMEAAVTGLKDAFDRLNPAKVHFNTWLWPLGQDKQYVAAGLTGCLKQL